MSFMRSFQEQAKRVFHQVDFLLSMKARAVYVITIVLSIMFSLGIVYQVYAVIMSMMMLGIIILEILTVSIAGSMIDEINEGVAQIYLSAGLSRREYVSAWIFVSIIYPVLALLASILLPALIIDPGIILSSITMGSITMFPTLLEFALAIMIQVFNNITISLAIGLKTRSKGWCYFMIVFILIILPLAASMIGFFLAASTGNQNIIQHIYLVMLPFSPVTMYMMSMSSSLLSIPKFVLLLVPLSVGFFALAYIFMYAREKMEV